jgi:hypothetical protein
MALVVLVARILRGQVDAPVSQVGLAENNRRVAGKHRAAGLVPLPPVAEAKPLMRLRMVHMLFVVDIAAVVAALAAFDTGL